MGRDQEDRIDHERWKAEKERLEEEQACSEFGFEPLIAEPSECERCGVVGTVYFGNQTYFEPRDGDYMCGPCVLKHCKEDE